MYYTSKSQLQKREQQLKDITQPHINDVLSGKGNFAKQWTGNEFYRHLIAQRNVEYILANQKERKSLALSIVNRIRKMKPPGRFLKQDPLTKLWFEIGDENAFKKTRQTFIDFERKLNPNSNVITPRIPHIEEVDEQEFIEEYLMLFSDSKLEEDSQPMNLCFEQKIDSEQKSNNFLSNENDLKSDSTTTTSTFLPSIPPRCSSEPIEIYSTNFESTNDINTPIKYQKVACSTMSLPVLYQDEPLNDPLEFLFSEAGADNT